MVAPSVLLADVEAQIQAMLSTGVEEYSAGTEKARMIRLAELRVMRRELLEEIHAASGETWRLVQPVNV